jgi:hypothetical protein
MFHLPCEDEDGAGAVGDDEMAMGNVWNLEDLL